MKKFVEQLKMLFSIQGLIGLLLTSLGIGYVLSGFDVIPDVIPFVGYFDDAAMVVITFLLAGMVVRKLLPGLGPKAGKK